MENCDNAQWENNDGSDKGSGEGCEGRQFRLCDMGRELLAATAAERHCTV